MLSEISKCKNSKKTNDQKHFFAELLLQWLEGNRTFKEFFSYHFMRLNLPSNYVLQYFVFAWQMFSCLVVKNFLHSPFPHPAPAWITPLCFALLGINQCLSMEADGRGVGGWGRCGILIASSIQHSKVRKKKSFPEALYSSAVDILLRLFRVYICGREAGYIENVIIGTLLSQWCCISQEMLAIVFIIMFPVFCLLFGSLESEGLIWQLFGYLEKDVTIHKCYVMLKNNGLPEFCINNREVGKFR